MKLKKLKKTDPIHFRGKSHFEVDGTQNYLAFHSMYRYFKRVGDVCTGSYIYFWKSKRFTVENITAPTTSDYWIHQQLSYLGNKVRLEFKGSCVKQDKIAYNHGKNSKHSFCL